jgi:hypothetical protein
MKKEMKSKIKWHDLDESLRDFIIIIARKFGLSDEYVQVLVDLIFDYGCKCYQESLGR